VDAKPGGGEGDLKFLRRCYSAGAHVVCVRAEQRARAGALSHAPDLLMRLLVVSIGRLKQGPERELAERYRERFRGLEIHEIPESRARDAATRIAEEAAAISAAIPEKSVLVALDERGKSVDSATFAQQLGRWRDEGVANTIFTIGGADGLSPDLQRKARLRIAFGSATWPHQMVRVMLLEQIYRAATILAGHPYHRA
jgi:23S rRNA (pseudouridine1915-N3)-methyltransferase